MKKRLLSTLIALVMSVTIVAAGIPAQPGSVVQAAGSSKTAGTRIGRDGMADKQDMADLNNMFNELVECYNMVVEYYNMSCMPANSQIENTLTNVGNLLEVIQVQKQGNLTRNQMLSLMQQMTVQAEALNNCMVIIDQQISVNGVGNMPVDEEIYQMLAESYSELVDTHNMVVDAYNAGLIRQGNDVAATLNSIGDFINMIGKFEQFNLTMSDAIEIQQYINEAADFLYELVSSL